MRKIATVSDPRTRVSERPFPAGNAWLGLGALLLVALGYGWGVFADRASLGLWAAYLFVSPVAYVSYWVDKRRAQTTAWRISEATLQGLALIGGWPGAFLAQHFLRHKNRKVPFQVVFWLIVVLHAVFWYFYLTRGTGEA